MKHNHVADASHPGKTALQQWLNGAAPDNLPSLRSQFELVRDFLAEHHNHRSGDVNPRDPMPMQSRCQPI